MRFTMDFLMDGSFSDEQISFDGIDLGSKWNGWSCPTFTKEVADDIVVTMSKCSNELGCMEFIDDANGGYYVCYEGDEEYERFEAVVIDGNMYYPIGAYSWMWVVVE